MLIVEFQKLERLKLSKRQAGPPSGDKSLGCGNRQKLSPTVIGSTRQDETRNDEKTPNLNGLSTHAALYLLPHPRAGLCCY